MTGVTVDAPKIEFEKASGFVCGNALATCFAFAKTVPRFQPTSLSTE